MEKQDLIEICRDCQKEFTITASEQSFYESKELAFPKRCAECRAARKAANTNINANNNTTVKEQPKLSLEDMMRNAGIN